MLSKQESAFAKCNVQSYRHRIHHSSPQLGLLQPFLLERAIRAIIRESRLALYCRFYSGGSDRPFFGLCGDLPLFSTKTGDFPGAAIYGSYIYILYLHAFMPLSPSPFLRSSLPLSPYLPVFKESIANIEVRLVTHCCALHNCCLKASC